MTAQAVLDVARREIGTVEKPPNSNRQRYGDEYGMPGVAWCAQFTWWCFKHAGLSGLIPKTAYTPTYYQWFVDHRQAGTQPRPGALVFFDFPNDGVNRISHVGIVEAVNRDGSITTIEGNTSSGAAGSQRDGGGVYRRTRKSGIVGYGYPAYGGVQPAPAPAGAPSGSKYPTIRKGDRGPAVATFQRFRGIPADGIFGSQTEESAKGYQRMKGLAVDGIVGPATWKATGL